MVSRSTSTLTPTSSSTNGILSAGLDCRRLTINNAISKHINTNVAALKPSISSLLFAYKAEKSDVVDVGNIENKSCDATVALVGELLVIASLVSKVIGIERLTFSVT